MKIKFKNKKKLFVKIVVGIAAVGLVLTTFLPFISFML